MERFISALTFGVKLEDVRVEHRPYQYLYKEGEDYIFMHTETYEQIPIAGDNITGVKFMKENDVVDVVVDASTETILFAEMPVKTVLQVTYTEPGEKGNTATNALKEATVETGAMVRVPLFINTDDMIRVDTRTGEESLTLRFFCIFAGEVFARRMRRIIGIAMRRNV